MSTSANMSWRDRLQRLIPTRKQLESNRWLASLAPWLSHPKLWHWSRRGVALAVSASDAGALPLHPGRKLSFLHLRSISAKS